jgi:hypothetical protein
MISGLNAVIGAGLLVGSLALYIHYSVVDEESIIISLLSTKWLHRPGHSSTPPRRQHRNGVAQLLVYLNDYLSAHRLDKAVPLAPIFSRQSSYGRHRPGHSSTPPRRHGFGGRKLLERRHVYKPVRLLSAPITHED